MQNPVPEEGELFSPDMIGVKVTAEDVFMWVRAWDLAGSVEGDWTVGVLMGKTRKGSYVVGDIVRFRGRPDTVRDRIVETARMDTKRIKISMPQDPGQAGIHQMEFYVS
jgi:phage terminase large subunit-like protein